jgi:nitrate reductase gamma subunit/ferredoxin
MAVTLDRTLLPTLKEYGTFDIEACFNCGNCTAVCPMTSDDATFPRRLIRYAQVGMKEELLSSKELWTCYYCGECSDTCPRQAEPGEFMAAARRYAVASYDRTHLASWLATSKVFATIFVVALVGVLAGFMYSVHGPADGSRLAFFEFVPEDAIHWLGVAVMAVMGVAALAGLVEMVRRVLLQPHGDAVRRTPRKVADAAFYAIATESLAQTRFRQDCLATTVTSGPTTADVDATRPWYLKRWFIHFATMWGFLGLLGATILDYGLAFFNIVPTGTPEPIYYPIRLLGTLSGAALIYGTTVFIIRRLRRSDRSSKHSTTSDWTLLLMLWVAGITGFALELALYMPSAPSWGYPMFLIHVGVAMALVLLVPFGKFAHVFYRPVALFALRLRA